MSCDWNGKPDPSFLTMVLIFSATVLAVVLFFYMLAGVLAPTNGAV